MERPDRTGGVGCSEILVAKCLPEPQSWSNWEV